MKELLRIEADL